VHVPVDQLGVVSSRQAEVFLLGFHELYGIDDVEMTLVQQLHALKVVVVQTGIALVIASSQDALSGLYFDYGELVEVRLFVSPIDLLDENTFPADVEGVDELPRSNK
jgi:hypothetical protein